MSPRQGTMWYLELNGGMFSTVLNYELFRGHHTILRI